MKRDTALNSIREKILEDWSEQSAQAQACLKILDYLASRKYSEVQHLTKRSFDQILGSSTENKLLIELLTYLIGKRVNVLTSHFELIDDEDEAYILDAQDIKALKERGQLVHPCTGELLASPEDKVFMFFSPSESFRRLQHP